MKSKDHSLLKTLHILKSVRQEDKYARGTVRNVFSALKKEDLIEFVHRSPQAFYTLTGVRFEKGMTPSYRGVVIKYKQRRLLRIFKVTKMNKPAIHDIRLLFNVRGLRNILLYNNNTSMIDKVDEKFNKNIVLKDIIHDDLIIKTTVHNTENVTVMIACSENPIEIEDPIALSKLIGGLTRVEERLQQEINHHFKTNSDAKDEDSQKISIPYHMNWIVTMWHFGRDSSHSYSGQLIEITWKDGLDLFHVYSKKKQEE